VSQKLDRNLQRDSDADYLVRGDYCIQKVAGLAEADLLLTSEGDVVVQAFHLLHDSHLDLLLTEQGTEIGQAPWKNEMQATERCEPRYQRKKLGPFVEGGQRRRVSKEDLDNIIIELLHCSLAGCMTTKRAEMSDKIRLSHWASQKLPKATASNQTLLLRLHLSFIVTDQLQNKGKTLATCLLAS
jgi:hypothetical protein